jgi:hypothetical protein
MLSRTDLRTSVPLSIHVNRKVHRKKHLTFSENKTQAICKPNLERREASFTKKQRLIRKATFSISKNQENAFKPYPKRGARIFRDNKLIFA